jgi:quinol monooxygenase YgiN
MEIRPSKQKELLQTIDGLTKAKKRSERGFLDARVKTDNENSHSLAVIEEWETVEDVEAYLQSEYFNILRGGMKFLTSSWEMEVCASGETPKHEQHQVRPMTMAEM